VCSGMEVWQMPPPPGERGDERGQGFGSKGGGCGRTPPPNSGRVGGGRGHPPPFLLELVLVPTEPWGWPALRFLSGCAPTKPHAHRNLLGYEIQFVIVMTVIIS